MDFRESSSKLVILRGAFDLVRMDDILQQGEVVGLGYGM